MGKGSGVCARPAMALAPSADTEAAAQWPARPRTTRGRIWTDATIRRLLEEFLREREEAGVEGWPAQGDFARAYKLELYQAMARHRGLAAWAREYGFEPNAQGAPRKWSEDRIRRELAQLVADGDNDGLFPSKGAFDEAGKLDLYNVVYRNIDDWCKEFGLRRRMRKVWDEPAIEAALRELLEGRSSWPTQPELKAAGAWSLMQAVYRTGGREYWGARLGIAVN